MTSPSRRRSNAARRRQRETDQLVERIANEKVQALSAAVDFSILHGAPEWVVWLVIPDLKPLLGKHPSRWQPHEIRHAQEAVNTLPFRLLMATFTPPRLI